MDLAVLEEIRQLKYRYLRCVDQKLWDEMADVFTEDATVDYGTHVYGKPLKLAGRDEIIAFFRAKLGPEIITVHAAGQPEITVDGDTATGTWRFEDTVIATEHRVVIAGAAFYQDRYERGAGRRLADRAHRLRAHLRGDDVARRPAELQVPGRAAERGLATGPRPRAPATGTSVADAAVR